MRNLVILIALPFALSGCVVASIASTAVDVVTLPVKAVSKAAELATTSQSEADERRGRDLRKAEGKVGRDLREAEKKCREAAPRGSCRRPRTD